MSIGNGRVVHEVLDGGLGQGGVTLPRRWRDVSQVISKALAVTGPVDARDRRRPLGGASRRCR